MQILNTKIVKMTWPSSHTVLLANAWITFLNKHLKIFNLCNQIGLLSLLRNFLFPGELVGQQGPEVVRMSQTWKYGAKNHFGNSFHKIAFSFRFWEINNYDRVFNCCGPVCDVLFLSQPVEQTSFGWHVRCWNEFSTGTLDVGIQNFEPSCRIRCTFSGASTPVRLTSQRMWMGK